MQNTGNKKAVLITGASTGIGLACAEHMNSLGFHVFAGVRKNTDATRLKDLMPVNMTPVILDVCKQDSITETFNIINEYCKNAEILGIVNNAGISLAGPLELLPLDEIRRQFEINITGQIAVTQQFIPLLRNNKGRIIFIGSTSGYFSAPFLAAYSVTKFGIEAICDALRVELAPWNIEVINIQPGQISTPIWDKSKDHAESVVDKLDQKSLILYESQMDKLRDMVEQNKKSASDVSVVSKAVAHALTSQKPKTHYKVGAGSYLQFFIARFIPARLRDILVKKFMHL